MISLPANKRGLLKIAGALILIVIICVVIAIIAMGAFSTPPEDKPPALNITPITPAPPTLSTITPPKGALGTIVPVTIEGKNFT
ncbi:MAG: hypothetical protein Q7U51_13355, partial [Methanoregula sp.]|nr:hypothetical protein [Methanoregula sp.]